MWRFVAVGLLIIGVVVFGFSLIEASTGNDIQASAVMSSASMDTTGYARAVEAREWNFPADFGAHPDFQTEWWYYTGNLADETGRRFGYQFTVFRRAITPETYNTDSEWRSGQVYMVHFTVSDIEGQQFYHQQRFSREGAGLAGAQNEPNYRVWVEDWQIVGKNDDDTLTQITADGGDFAVDFALEQLKTPALQGDNGLSAKGGDEGNASYYYSLSRLLTTGTLRLGEQTFNITGTTWKDHEFSTSALGTDALGWDWFGLQFDDNRELMIGQIRLTDGGREPAFGGLFVNEDGSTQYLKAEDFTIEATGEWTSPHTSANYPAGWTVTLNSVEAEPITFTVTPMLADQELHGGSIAYWEGAVQLSGDVSGYGYAELTGYVDSMIGRF